MDMLIKIAIGAAAMAFVMAVISSVFASGQVLGVVPEAYSRASSNLALLAIAATVCLNRKPG